MKKMMLWVLLCAVSSLFLCGCGDVDESKSPEAIRAEAVNMDLAALEKKVNAYRQAVEKKSDEIAKELGKLSALPLKDMAGDEGARIRQNVEKLKGSLDKLKANMDAYAEALKAKLN